MRTTTDADNHAQDAHQRPQLAVWLCDPPQHERPRGAAAVMEIARRTINHYSDADELVLDPDCRDGLLIEQAALLGRRAVGASGDHHLAACAANRLARHDPAATQAAVVVDGHFGELPYLLATKVLPQLTRRRSGGREDNVVALAQQRFALILTELTAPHDHARGSLRECPPLEYLGETCVPLLQGGGFLALLLSPLVSRRPDQPRRSIRVLEQAGLQYWQHVIALSGSSTLVHRDLLVFRRPKAAANTEARAADKSERRAA